MFSKKSLTAAIKTTATMSKRTITSTEPYEPHMIMDASESDAFVCISGHEEEHVPGTLHHAYAFFWGPGRHMATMDTEARIRSYTGEADVSSFCCCSLFCSSKRGFVGRRMQACLADGMCTLKGVLACSMVITFAAVVFFVLWASVLTAFSSVGWSASASTSSSSWALSSSSSSSFAAGYNYVPGTFDTERVEEAIARLIERFLLNTTTHYHNVTVFVEMPTPTPTQLDNSTL